MQLSQRPQHGTGPSLSQGRARARAGAGWGLEVDGDPFSVGKTMEKPWEKHGKPWETMGNHGETMGNHGKTMEKSWKNHVFTELVVVGISEDAKHILEGSSYSPSEVGRLLQARIGILVKQCHQPPI